MSEIFFIRHGQTSFGKRVDDGLRQVTGRYGRSQRLAVFTSGGPISAVLKSALQLSDRMAVSASWQVMNASITSFKYNSEAFMLREFNNTKHLMLEKDPALLTHR